MSVADTRSSPPAAGVSGWPAVRREYGPCLAVALPCLAAAAAWGLCRPPYGDEVHFLAAARYFGDEVSLRTLGHYEELATPLTFVVYGLWGRVVGFEPPRLRLLSLVIALSVFLQLYRSAREAGLRRRSSALLLAVLGANPYVVGASVLVYTDMPAMLALVSASRAVLRDRLAGVAGWLAVALLCRQYLVFLWLAAGSYYGLRLLARRRASDLGGVLAVATAMLPFAGLVWLWGGHIAPVNHVRTLYLQDPPAFSLAALTLYLSAPAVYLFPLVLLRARDWYTGPGIGLAVALLPLPFLAPVGPAPSQLRAGWQTVGLFDRLAHAALGAPLLVAGAWAVAFLLTVPVLVTLVRASWRRIGRGEVGFPVFLDLLTVSFLLIMPLAYIWWEKYALPLLVGLALRMALHPANEPRQPPAVPGRGRIPDSSDRASGSIARRSRPRGGCDAWRCHRGAHTL